MKVIASESLGLEYTWDVISSCDQNGMQAIADNQNNEILFYDPKNRQYCTNKDLMNADYSIHDVFTDKSVRSQVMKPTSGQGFEKFATKWDALQKSDDQDVIKTKNCSMIRFGAHESKKPRIVGNRKPRKEFMDKVERFRSKWKSLDDKDDYVDDFGDRVNGVEAEVSEGLDDNPNDWSANEDEVEIQWVIDDKDFGIESSSTETFVIDLDLVDSFEELVYQVTKAIEKEYGGMQFDYDDDWVFVDEDMLLKKFGYSDMDVDMVNEDSSGKFDVEIEFIEDSLNANCKKGEKITFPIDLEDASEECMSEDEVKWYVVKKLKSYVISSGLKEKSEAGWLHPDDYRIVNKDELLKAIQGDEGWTEEDYGNMTVDDLPKDMTLKEAMRFYHKMDNAYDDHKVNYKKFRELDDGIVDSVVDGLLKENSIEDLAEEWFIDYGTMNGWGWQTSFKYGIARKLHQIHMKKHPDEHKPVPQRNHWRGWHEDNCSCGFCSSSDSSD